VTGEEGAQFDIGALMSQLGQVQENLQQAQARAASEVVEGSAGGGAVRVRVTGAFEFESVTIDPAVVDPDDVEMLQDLVLAAVRDAVEQAAGLTADALGGGGLDLGGALGGLLGGADGPSGTGP